MLPSNLFPKLIIIGTSNNWDKIQLKNVDLASNLSDLCYSRATLVYEMLNFSKYRFTENEKVLGSLASFFYSIPTFNSKKENLYRVVDFKEMNRPTIEEFRTYVSDLNFSETDVLFSYVCLLSCSHLSNTSSKQDKIMLRKLKEKLEKEAISTRSIDKIAKSIFIANILSSYSLEKIPSLEERFNLDTLFHSVGLHYTICMYKINPSPLSAFLNRTAIKVFKNQKFVPILFYPNGIITVNKIREFDEERFIKDFQTQLRFELSIQLVKKHILQKFVNMEIDQTMIYYKEIIALETLKPFLRIGKSKLTPKKQLRRLSGKEQNEVLLIRLICNLIVKLKEKIQEKYPEREKNITEKIDSIQEEVFGSQIDNLYKYSRYETIRDELYYTISNHLTKKELLNRSLIEMEEKESLKFIETLGIYLFERIQKELKECDKLSLNIPKYQKLIFHTLTYPSLPWEEEEKKKKEKITKTKKLKQYCTLCNLCYDYPKTDISTNIFMRTTKKDLLRRPNMCELGKLNIILTS